MSDCNNDFNRGRVAGINEGSGPGLYEHIFATPEYRAGMTLGASEVNKK